MLQIKKYPHRLMTSFERNFDRSFDPEPTPGEEVIITQRGAFLGQQAVVLKVMSPAKRVQLLLDLLGQPVLVEADVSEILRKHFDPRESFAL